MSDTASLYPKYYKRVPAGVSVLDVYAVCKMFDVTDAALSHSLKKIMLPGTRTGGKNRYDDIKEARDTLNRWLELNMELAQAGALATSKGEQQ